MIEKTDQGDQHVLPGCERTALQAQAARDQQGRGMMRHKKPQREPGPLFEAHNTTQMTSFLNGGQKCR